MPYSTPPVDGAVQFNGEKSVTGLRRRGRTAVRPYWNIHFFNGSRMVNLAISILMYKYMVYERSRRRSPAMLVDEFIDLIHITEFNWCMNFPYLSLNDRFDQYL
jgi:hypothetical protein